jgi:hypothetical protein
MTCYDIGKQVSVLSGLILQVPEHSWFCLWSPFSRWRSNFAIIWLCLNLQLKDSGMCPVMGLRCYKHNWPYAIWPHLWLDRLFLYFWQSFLTVGDVNFCNPEQSLATFETWIPFRGSCCTLGITKGFSQSHRNGPFYYSHTRHTDTQSAQWYLYPVSAPCNQVRKCGSHILK